MSQPFPDTEPIRVTQGQILNVVVERREYGVDAPDHFVILGSPKSLKIGLQNCSDNEIVALLTEASAVGEKLEKLGVVHY